MVLFRALSRNTLAGEIERFSTQLHVELAEMDPTFEHGLVATTCVPVRYLALQAAGQPELGAELMLSFWAWGNDAPETLENLDRTMSNLTLGLRRACAYL
jgi:hypothetical protein